MDFKRKKRNNLILFLEFSKNKKWHVYILKTLCEGGLLVMCELNDKIDHLGHYNFWMKLIPFRTVEINGHLEVQGPPIKRQGSVKHFTIGFPFSSVSPRA